MNKAPTVSERFLKYVSYDTASCYDATEFPSTAKQKELGKALVSEMLEMGISDAHMDGYGYVYGTIPANTDQPRPVVGLIAHMDTSPDLSGANVNPKMVHYEGGDIVLNEGQKIILRADEFTCLKNYTGMDLIVTDGTTLLGGDDKAGIAEILTAAQKLMETPTIPHGTIKIAFTPDEEVGSGVDHFDVEAFGADYAYTLDGGELGEIEYENFNAAEGIVTIQGKSTHPGGAKGKMNNAMLIGMEFQQMLPAFENPAYTEGYEGFYHLNRMEGNVEQAKLHYIIRDHDWDKFQSKKARMEANAAFLNEKYGAGTVSLTMEDTYYNMKQKIETKMEIIDRVTAAMDAMGIEPVSIPIRGGTDGARLSYMGLPCPNLCTGGHNAHSRYEFVCIQSMERIVDLLLKLVEDIPVTA